MLDILNAQIATVIYIVIIWAELLLIIFLLSKFSGEKELKDKIDSLSSIVEEHDRRVFEQNKKLKTLFYRSREGFDQDESTFTGKNRKIDEYSDRNRNRRKDDKYSRFDEEPEDTDSYKELKK